MIAISTVRRLQVRRLRRFASTGIAAAIVQLLLLDRFDDAGWQPLLANALALLLSTQVNFILSYLYTWGDRRPGDESTHAIGVRWLEYHSSAAVAAVLNMAIFAVVRLTLPLLLASALGTAGAATINFIAGDRIVFRHRAHRGRLQRVTDLGKSAA